MIEWRDEGLLLAARPHGEGSAIVEVFTADHGRHAGVVRGGASRRMAPVLQPGAQVAVVWKARIEDHLGAFVIEPLQSRAALVLQDRLALAGLNAVCALLSRALPEREAHPALYAATLSLLEGLGRGAGWALDYLGWELALLEDQGYGLDLETCAVTGRTEGLVHVSPRSGRAVSAEGAGDWADRLLPLPPVLRGAPMEAAGELVEALRTTGWFIEHRLLADLGAKGPPAARDRLVAAIARMQAE